MFLDEKQLHVKAGRGGDGASLFRREIYVPRGGPDGGDGGHGGSVYVEGQNNLHALVHLSFVNKVEADEGKIGGHSRSTGKSGADQVIPVPVGTEVWEVTEDGERVLLAEILKEGQRMMGAEGGNGGWGNWHFRSSINQAPERANFGQEGEEKDIYFSLRLIADVGLVGLPNAGKSTFLSVVTAATPKIADYPFTTLEPQLGVATVDEHALVIADIPGLIEGASAGKGLGTAFLKHIERTKTILHLIDASMGPDEVVEAYKTIRKELEQTSEVLGKKKEIVALTKTEMLDDELRQMTEDALAKIGVTNVLHLSAVTHQGVREVLLALI